MSTTHTTHTTGVQALFSAIVGFLHTRADNARLYRDYTRTVNQLSSLTNRELADIGLSRGMINSVAYENTYGTPRR